MADPEAPLTPRQIQVLDELLAIGADRPSTDADLADEVTQLLHNGTAAALEQWTEPSLFLSKSQHLTRLRCEGMLAAEAQTPRAAPKAALVAGTIAHRAVQIAHTHPRRSVDDYVRDAIVGARQADQDLDAWWAQASAADQSDLISSVLSKVTSFLDDFPPLDPAWSPRFEEPIAAKVGRLRMSTRADLVLGRPRGDHRQTLLLIDLKGGALRDEHLHEARFYALVATLRYKVAPWRSTVYSLASGEWVEPTVDRQTLLATAEQVATSARSVVELMTEQREPALTPGAHCRFCPARDSCAVAAV